MGRPRRYSSQRTDGGGRIVVHEQHGRASSVTLDREAPGAERVAASEARRDSRTILSRARQTVGRTSTLLASVVALAFALAARVPYFVGSDFPLNDGAMFVAMSRDVLASGYALPYVTSYNFEGIPFAYPPASFYVVSIITGATGIDPISLARYLPLAANLATVVAVSVLARSFLTGRAALLASVFFALVPRSYEWLIMGGGLTRSLAFFFAVMCLVQARHVFGQPTLWRTAWCALFAALALATHLELGVFLVYSLGLMLLCWGRSRQALVAAAAIAVCAVGLTSPWWGTVLSRYGVAPFVAASHTGGWTSLVEQLRSLEAFLTPPRLLLSLPGALAVLGACACLLRGQLLLPVWLPLIFVLNPRSAATYATLPMSLLAAVGLVEVVGPGLAIASTRARQVGTLSTLMRPLLSRYTRAAYAQGVLGCAALLLALFSVYLSWPSIHPNRQALDSLSVDDRQAMAWVSQHTAPESQFLVLTRGWTWEDDHVGEWFPELAQRRSVLTPQGAEWLPNDLNLRKRCLYDQARQFGSLQWGVDRFDEWARDRGIPFSHIYVSASVRGRLDWRPLIASARASSDYRVSYEAPGVVVLERREPVPLRWESSGQLLIARDCTSLSEQPSEVQQAWELAYGPFAGRAWVEQHDQGPGGDLALPQRLRLFVFGPPAR
jgi:hypothetical protein